MNKVNKASSISKDFPTATKPSSEANWQKLIAKAVGDKTYQDALCHKSEDGFFIDPAPKASAHNTPHQKQSGDYVLVAFIERGTIACANDDILKDLAGGAGAVHIVLDIEGKRGRGIVIHSQDDFSKLLAGVYLNFIPLTIDAGQGYTKAIEMLMHEYQIQEVDPSKAVARLNVALTKRDVGLSQLILSIRKNLPNFSCVGVDGAACHNAGASEAQELAFMLASGVAALRQMESVGLSVAEANAQIIFHIGLSQDVFLGIAKIRSFRYMWGEILKNCGLDSAKAALYAQTSQRMMSVEDIEVNILRTTAASFAAMLGGVDGLSILPYDLSLSSDATHRKARRAARNIAIILEEEGFLTRTHDVSAGSHSIEALGDQLSQTAWGLFQQIEIEGGIALALENGTIASWMLETSEKRNSAIASGETTIIGVNAFREEIEKGGAA
jgi:methylmalonyl-CoA mutase